MDEDPQDLLNAIVEAREALIEQGVVEMIGRTASGQAIYDLSDVTWRILIRRWILCWSRESLLAPTLVIEYVIRCLVHGLAFVFELSRFCGRKLNEIAERLWIWRQRWTRYRDNVWLSIKLD